MEIVNCKGKQVGLTTSEAVELQKQYGKNELVREKKENVFSKISQIVTEPMFLLLIIAATIYFVLGEPKDGAIMLVFVIAIISIEVIQELKTDKTLEALNELSSPRISVMRDGKKKVINSSDLVPGDIMYVSEGAKIPADGIVVNASTLCVNESSLTGEPLGVWKLPRDNCNDEINGYWRRDNCYAGTFVTQGTGTILVKKIGLSTVYGKIGKDIAVATTEKTPLQKQTSGLVKISGVIAAALFVLVSIVTFFNLCDHVIQDRITESILSGITLAMAVIPEEFPVILTVFPSMGAWRLAKKKSLVRKLPSVETLGAVSVLCVDKTGTITMNKMVVREIFSVYGDEEYVSNMMGMGCKQTTYDPMEKAILDQCGELGFSKEILFGGQLLKEYVFTDEEKMMGHVWRTGNEIMIVAKGAPESILKICNTTAGERRKFEDKIYQMSQQGLRVIAVGKMTIQNENDIPDTLSECRLEFLGMMGFTDPPRESVKENIEVCTKAGVRVVMITGDSGVTAKSIANQINMPNSDNIITGDEISKMDNNELKERVRDVSIFCRVLPEHKMRIVKAFKENGEVVAMTGDGVNDATALKYSDIGISMGKRGCEVSREASDLILLNDNFSTIVDTIKDGRRIYDNIRKAVGYVFTIHIPIALSSLIAPMIGINPTDLLLLPIHVVLLELVIDPTCSVVLERQPAELDIMQRSPRSMNAKLLTIPMLLKSVTQGLAIFVASFAMYYYFINLYPNDSPLARTMGLSVIFLSNVLLVQVNGSDTEFAIKTFMRQINDKITWGVIIGTLVGLFIMIYTPLSQFLKLAPLSATQMLLSVGVSFIAVLWYELVKAGRHLVKLKRS